MTQQSKIPANRINVEELQQSLGGGLELGDIGIAPLGIDETKNLRRYLNGQVIIQTQFAAFTSLLKEKVLTYANLSTTEENWQAEVTNSKLGQCGKFVIDDNTGTIRLPKVVNINGLQDLSLLGSIKAESLPNITGHAGGLNIARVDGAFSYDGTANGATGNVISLNVLKFDASLSSSTYQDNAPVQQEAAQYPYFIQVATGNEEQADITTEIQLNNPFSLLDYKWSEYELTNASWLLSDGAFHSGSTYVSVYDLLLRIYNGTETKEGVSVKLSTETYEDTDFVLNTADTTFRLPIKVKLASGKGVVGNGALQAVSASNLNGNPGDIYTNGNTAMQSDIFANGVRVNIAISPDPTKSGIETSSQDLYLYFYVGETVQDANIIAASNVLTNAVMKNSSADKATVVGWGMPDYSAAVNVSFPYTAEYDCWAYVKTAGSTGVDNTIAVSGKQVYARLIAVTSTTTSMVPMSKGETISITGSGSSSCIIYPCKGAK